MAGLIGLAGLGYFALRNDAETLREASQENLFWNAAQLEIEYHRFTSSLGGVASGAEGYSAAEVRRRFDVLTSHVEGFVQGDGSQKLLAYDRTGGAIRRLQAELLEITPQIETLSNEDTDRIRRMITVFRPLADDIRLLAARVGSGEVNSVAGIRERLKQGAAMTAMFSSVALVIGAIVIAMLYLESP